MKAKIIMLIALIFAAITSTQAQQQGFQRKTVAEIVQSSMEKISDPLKLDKDQQDKTTAVLTDFYTIHNKMREGARSSGNRPDHTEIEKMANDRDEKLKSIFSLDQYNKFKNEIEPSLRPQRRNNGQGVGNN